MPRHRESSRLAVTLLAISVLPGCSADAGGAASSSSPSAAPDSPPASVTSSAGWIAYQSESPRGPDGIYLIRPDGTDQHEILLDVAGQRRHPDFSPDGTMLAFDQSDGTVDQVYISSSNGSEPRLAVACDPASCIQIWEPSWSPDGTRLAVATTMPGNPWRMGIAIVDVTTGSSTQIVEHAMDDGQDHSPRWSPDGERLVFWRGSATADGGDCAVFSVAVDGTGLTQLTDDDLVAGDPDFSSSGDRIVFGSHPLLQYPDAGRSELYTMAPDGADVRQLTDFGDDGPRATQPRWAPDGDAILYVRTTQTGLPRHVYAMAADGTSDGPVADADPIYTHPVLQPTQ